MTRADSPNPWNTLWAMMVGRFLIMVDASIVVVAYPSIEADMDAGYDHVIWVTSAYLLAFAVPLLVAGRLGDRVGPKNVYTIGLAVFTVASLGCGLSGTIQMLIAARALQGIGAALLTPQTLSTVTQIFPAERRGVAISMWAAVGALALLVGPPVGGLLVDTLGWHWIFLVNVPIGIVGLVLGVRLIPVLPTRPHRLDLVSVALSGVGMFLIVFALQEGQRAGWPLWIWAMIVAGIGLMAAFVHWDAVNTPEPLIPREIFRDRDFVLCTLGAAVVYFIGTGLVLPWIFFAQSACGLSPLRSSLLLLPMSIVSVLLAPVAGKIIDRSRPRPVIGFGFTMLAIALAWLSVEMSPATPIWRLVAPTIAAGVGMAFLWSPLTTTATRKLPPYLAGAGAGVYNTTQQLGAALGSAGMAAFMASRVETAAPGLAAHGTQSPVVPLPELMRAPFSGAMSQSMLLPAVVALVGIVLALFMVGLDASATAREPMRTDADD